MFKLKLFKSINGDIILGYIHNKKRIFGVLLETVNADSDSTHDYAISNTTISNEIDSSDLKPESVELLNKIGIFAN